MSYLSPSGLTDQPPPSTNPKSPHDNQSSNIEQHAGATLSSAVQLEGPLFCGNIPDYILVDRDKIGSMPIRHRGRRSLSAAMHWAIYHAVVTRESDFVILPDRYLAQIVWGADHWPANWRQSLCRWMLGPTEESQAERDCCGPSCPMYETGIPHMHFAGSTGKVTLGGSLYEYGTRDTSNGRDYNFSPRQPEIEEDSTREEKKEIKDEWKRVRQLRRTNIFAAYLPALLFGASPRVGLSDSQRLLIVGLVAELTRVAKTRTKTSTRPDKAAIVTGTQVPGESSRIVKCPLLDAGRRYVAFCGNGRRAGQGYKIRGRTLRGWLNRCGYSTHQIYTDPAAAINHFLHDLTELAGPFQLTIAAYHPQRREWRSLDDLIAAMLSTDGSLWLDNCLLRVYAPENYLELWRQHFARCLGFSEIPGGNAMPTASGGDFETQATSGPGPMRSPSDVRAWLRRKGMNQKQLARELGLSAARVSQQLSGKRSWSTAFEQQVQALAERLGPRIDSDPGTAQN